MPEASPDQSLHLPSLVIKNFRGIDELTIPRLGRVTLLAGKNGVGKTTVLDAVRVWADRGNCGVFDAVLIERGDFFKTTSDRQPSIVLDRTALFTARDYGPESMISIGPTGDKGDSFQIEELSRNSIGHPLTPSKLSDAVGNIGLVSQFIASANPHPREIKCHVLGPNAPTNETIEQYWSEVALTSHEDRALEALNLITNTKVERVAALGPPVSGGTIQPRRVMAKVTGIDYQVPLRTLGDGAMRTYAVALALAKSSDGFLLIDEAENGIHHSVQPKFWKMVLQTAQRNNVQVLATTHSSDCAYRFGQVASELEDIEGIFYRIQRNGERLRAVPYPEDQLVIAAEHRIEVR